MSSTIRLLRPDGHGIMEAVFQAYASPQAAPSGGAGVSKGSFLALLSDLGVVGAAADSVIRDGVWEVNSRGLQQRRSMETCAVLLMLMQSRLLRSIWDFFVLRHRDAERGHTHFIHSYSTLTHVFSLSHPSHAPTLSHTSVSLPVCLCVRMQHFALVDAALARAASVGSGGSAAEDPDAPLTMPPSLSFRVFPSLLSEVAQRLSPTTLVNAGDGSARQMTDAEVRQRFMKRHVLPLHARLVGALAVSATATASSATPSSPPSNTGSGSPSAAAQSGSPAASGSGSPAPRARTRSSPSSNSGSGSSPHSPPTQQQLPAAEEALLRSVMQRRAQSASAHHQSPGRQPAPQQQSHQPSPQRSLSPAGGDGTVYLPPPTSRSQRSSVAGGPSGSPHPPPFAGTTGYRGGGSGSSSVVGVGGGSGSVAPDVRGTGMSGSIVSAASSVVNGHSADVRAAATGLSTARTGASSVAGGGTKSPSGGKGSGGGAKSPYRPFEAAGSARGMENSDVTKGWYDRVDDVTGPAPGTAAIGGNASPSGGGGRIPFLRSSGGGNNANSSYLASASADGNTTLDSSVLSALSPEEIEELLLARANASVAAPGGGAIRGRKTSSSPSRSNRAASGSPSAPQAASPSASGSNKASRDTPSSSSSTFEAFLLRQKLAEEARQRELEDLRHRLEANRLATEQASTSSSSATPAGGAAGSPSRPTNALGAAAAAASGNVPASAASTPAAAAAPSVMTRAGLERLTAPTESGRHRMAATLGTSGSNNNNTASGVSGGPSMFYAHQQAQVQPQPTVAASDGGASVDNNAAAYFRGEIYAHSQATLARRQAAVAAVLAAESAARNGRKASDYSTALVRRRLARELAVASAGIATATCAAASASASAVAEGTNAGASTVPIPWWLLPLSLPDVAAALSRLGFLPSAPAVVGSVSSALAAVAAQGPAPFPVSPNFPPHQQQQNNNNNTGDGEEDDDPSGAGAPSALPAPMAAAQALQQRVLAALPPSAGNDATSASSGASARLLARVWLALSLAPLAQVIGPDAEMQDDGASSAAASVTPSSLAAITAVPAVRLLCLLQSVVTHAYDVQAETLLAASLEVGLPNAPSVPIPSDLAHSLGLTSSLSAEAGSGDGPSLDASAAASGSGDSAGADSSSSSSSNGNGGPSPFLTLFTHASARLQDISAATAVSPLKPSSGNDNSSGSGQQAPLPSAVSGSAGTEYAALPDSQHAPTDVAASGASSSSASSATPFLHLAGQPLRGGIFWPGHLLHPLKALYAARLQHLGSLKRSAYSPGGGGGDVRKKQSAGARKTHHNTASAGSRRRSASVEGRPLQPAEAGSSAHSSAFTLSGHNSASDVSAASYFQDEHCTFAPLLSKRSLALAAKRDAVIAAQLLGQQPPPAPSSSPSPTGVTDEAAAAEDGVATAAAAPAPTSTAALKVPREMLLLAYGLQRQAKAASLRAAVNAAELAECSFRPETNAGVGVSSAGVPVAPAPATGVGGGLGASFVSSSSASSVARGGGNGRRSRSLDRSLVAGSARMRTPTVIPSSSSAGTAAASPTAAPGGSASTSVVTATVNGTRLYVPPYARDPDVTDLGRILTSLSADGSYVIHIGGGGAPASSPAGTAGVASSDPWFADQQQAPPSPSAAAAAGNGSSSSSQPGSRSSSPSGGRSGSRSKSSSSRRPTGADKQPHAWPAASATLLPPPSAFTPSGAKGASGTTGSAADDALNTSAASAATAAAAGGGGGGRIDRGEWLFRLAAAQSAAKQRAQVAWEAEKAAAELEGCTFAPALGSSSSSYAAVSGILSASASSSSSSVAAAASSDAAAGAPKPPPSAPVAAGRAASAGKAATASAAAAADGSGSAAAVLLARLKAAKSASAAGGEGGGGDAAHGLDVSAGPLDLSALSSDSLASTTAAAAAAAAPAGASSAAPLPHSRGMEKWLARMAHRDAQKAEKALLESALREGSIHRLKRVPVSSEASSEGGAVSNPNASSSASTNATVLTLVPPPPTATGAPGRKQQKKQKQAQQQRGRSADRTGGSAEGAETAEPAQQQQQEEGEAGSSSGTGRRQRSLVRKGVAGGATTDVISEGGSSAARTSASVSRLAELASPKYVGSSAVGTSRARVSLSPLPGMNRALGSKKPSASAGTGVNESSLADVSLSGLSASDLGLSQISVPGDRSSSSSSSAASPRDPVDTSTTAGALSAAAAAVAAARNYAANAAAPVPPTPVPDVSSAAASSAPAPSATAASSSSSSSSSTLPPLMYVDVAVSPQLTDRVGCLWSICARVEAWQLSRIYFNDALSVERSLCFIIPIFPLWFSPLRRSRCGPTATWARWPANSQPSMPCRLRWPGGLRGCWKRSGRRCWPTRGLQARSQRNN